MNDAADPSLKALRLRVELAGDFVVALAAFDDHEILEQAVAIVVERADLDRSSRPPARRQEAMSVRRGARVDVLHLRALRGWCARNRERHDAAAVGVEQPTDGA